jgi:hypothetical protein
MKSDSINLLSSTMRVGIPLNKDLDTSHYILDEESVENSNSKKFYLDSRRRGFLMDKKALTNFDFSSRHKRKFM